MEKEKLLKAAELTVDSLRDDLIQVSHTIFENPEMSYQEYKASALLSATIEKYGFVVESGEGQIRTALRADGKSPRDGLNIGFISEYDALPNGHSCGHNLIAASGVFSAIVFDKLIREFDLKANAVFLGTPAEEDGGGKAKMLEANMFHDVNYAMMIHPCDSTMVEDWSLAAQRIHMTFFGQTAHAVASPWLGANAQSAAVETINLVNAWRSQCRDYTRVWANIRDCGTVTNIVPDRVEMDYSIRSDDVNYFRTLVEIVENCAKCAAKAFNCSVIFEKTVAYEPVKNDKKLEEHMKNAFERLGETVIPRYRDHGIGGTDMGNVTQRLPGIHGHLYLGPVLTHSDEFREAAGGPEGDLYVVKATKAMVMTAIGLIMDPDIVK